MQKACYIHEVGWGYRALHLELTLDLLRYLNALCSQVVALISDEDASRIDWRLETQEPHDEIVGHCFTVSFCFVSSGLGDMNDDTYFQGHATSYANTRIVHS